MIQLNENDELRRQLFHMSLIARERDELVEVRQRYIAENERLKSELEKAQKERFTKEQVMPLIKLLQDSLKALCAWGPSPADVFIVNEIQSALAHAKEMGIE